MYQIRDEHKECLPVRIIGPEGHLFAEFTPQECWIDPCSQSKRYLVNGGEYPWYSVVVVGYDSDREIASKIEQTVAVTNAMQAVSDAHNNLRKVRGW